MLLGFKYKTLTNRFLVMARLICVVVLFCLTYCGGPQDASAQFDGGGDFGLPTDGGDFGGGDGGGDGGDFGGGGIGGGGLGGGTGGDGAFGDDFGNVLGGEQTDDQRNQGFVGATGTRIQQNGFVGPPGETSGAPLADGASFGGGTNGAGGGGGGGGGGSGGGGGNNRNSGFGGPGQEKGFQVFRSSVRANLRPRFSFPQVNGSQVADRFQNRIRRIPHMGNDGAGVQISISNRTATIQGFVGSAEERDRIERQLRLEPGVYRINDQSQIVGQ